MAFVACVKVFAAQTELFDEAPWNANGGASAFLHSSFDSWRKGGVVLRFPMYKVGTGANSVLIVSPVGNPHQRPGAIFILEKAGVGHLFLGAPGAEIAINKSASMPKNLPMDAVAAIFKGKSSSVDVGFQPSFSNVICKGKGGE